MPEIWHTRPSQREHLFGQSGGFPRLRTRKRRERDWNVLEGIFDLLGCEKLTGDLTPQLLQARGLGPQIASEENRCRSQSASSQTQFLILRFEL